MQIRSGEHFLGGRGMSTQVLCNRSFWIPLGGLDYDGDDDGDDYYRCYY